MVSFFLSNFLIGKYHFSFIFSWELLFPAGGHYLLVIMTWGEQIFLEILTGGFNILKEPLLTATPVMT